MNAFWVFKGPMRKKLRTSEIAAVDDTDARIDAMFERLRVAQGRLAELLWDVDSEDLRNCVIELDAVIREQKALQLAIRRQQRSAAHPVNSEALASPAYKTVN